jgi:hypothetical protein
VWVSVPKGPPWQGVVVCEAHRENYYEVQLGDYPENVGVVPVEWLSYRADAD